MIFIRLVAALLLMFVFSVLMLGTFTLFINTNKEYDEDSRFYRWLLNVWTGFAIVILGIRIKKTGMDKLPEGRFLLVQNHRSNYDPILTWYILKKYNISFVSKKENFKVPFFGRLIRRCCFREIDRENPGNAIKTIESCAKLLTEDKVSIGIYPEGTRNKNSDEQILLPFHNAVFKIAQYADVPVVVTTISGTEKIYKNILRSMSNVEFDIVDVLYPEDFRNERTGNIGKKVEKLMTENLIGQNRTI